MKKELLTEKLREAVINCDEEKARSVASEILKANIDPIGVIESHLVPALKVVGDRFDNGEYFLTHLMWAGEIMKSVTNILTANMSELSEMKLKKLKVGTIVIGTVKGDIHDIGKNIVSLLLEVNGFDVHDIGKEVSPMEFIEKAEAVNANIIALSSLMSTTMAYQAETIRYLAELGLRERYKVIVGGGPTSESWAEKIGADGWAKDAPGAVELAKKLLQRKETAANG